MAALTLGLGALVFGTATAANAVPGDHVSAELWIGNTTKLEAGDQVREGDPLTLRINYSEDPSDSLAGQEVVFEFSGVDLTLDPNPDYSGNEAIESVTVSGNTVTVKFKETWPTGVTNGYFGTEFSIENIDSSGLETISWTMDEEEGGSLELYVIEENDVEQNVTAGAAKAAGTPSATLSSFVQTRVDATENRTVFEGVDCVALNGTVIPYTLTLNTPEGTTRTDYVITDTLPAGLDYVANSASAQITTWDENGFNQSTGSFAGGTAAATSDGLTYTIPELVGPSILTVTFNAVFALDSPECDALEARLQTAFEGLNGGGGGFSVNLTNIAAFPTIGNRTANTAIGGSIPGPGIGSAFGKSDNLGDFYVVTDDDGTILQHGSPLVDGPVNVDYTLRANLTLWNASSGDFTLTNNVVITDTLPTTASWNTSHASFITTTGNIALTEAATCPADISGNSFVGTWCVDGQTFRANIGQNNTTNGTIVLKALLNEVDTVAGMQRMTGNDDTDLVGGERWRLRNTANFKHLSTGSGTNFMSDIFPIVLPEENTDGLNDSETFLKSAPASVSVAQNTSAVIPFTLRVDTARAGISPSNLTIVDYVDHTVFDLGDAPAFAGATISGTYSIPAGTNLTAADFVLSLDDDGNLVIQLAETTADAMTAGGVLTINLGLHTHVLEGKSTFDVTNRATLMGDDVDHVFWSEQSSRATSFGNEAEARKVLIDPATGDEVSTLPVQVDEDGVPVGSDVFVYRLMYIGHGNFTANINDYNLADTLPAGVEFVGFLQPDALDDPEGNALPGPINAGGNVVATFVDGATDDDPGRVTLTQQPGTLFTYQEPAVIYFAVRVAEITDNVVNNFSGREATILPYGPPSIDIEKWNDEGADPVVGDEPDSFDGDHDTGRGASLTLDEPETVFFTITNNGTEALTNVKVSDELVDGVNAITGLSCDIPEVLTEEGWAGPFAPGDSFECSGTMPGLGLGQTHRDTATVTGTGVFSGTDVDDSDDWNAHVKSFAVGDYVWIDSNRDGLQGDDETPLEGVQVELLDENGDLIPGRVTFTDERGRYIFDELPAGTYQVRFTLTEEQGKLYRYTSLESGSSDPEVDSEQADSNADVSLADPLSPLVGVSRQFVLDEDNTQLVSDEDYEFFSVTATEGVDPTWDAGVIEIQYAVGDFVWIDANNNGIQDPSEKPLAGVKVDLLDGKGKVVKTTTTDVQGRYMFDRLPAGDYQIRFTLTPQQAAIYQFTSTGKGTHGTDSNATPQGAGNIGLTPVFNLGPDNASLTHVYDRDVWASEGIDPTWDAGVVLRPAALTSTGGAVLTGAIALAVITILGGGMLLLLSRRKREAESDLG